MAEELFYVAVPTDLVVKKYPKIPQPQSQKGTKEQWDEFWLKRDAFLFNCGFLPAFKNRVDHSIFKRGPTVESLTNEQRNNLFDTFLNRPKFANCQTSRGSGT